MHVAHGRLNFGVGRGTPTELEQFGIGYEDSVLRLREGGSAHPQRMHAGGLACYASQDIHDRTGHMASHGHLSLDVIRLLAVGEVAMPSE
jgi:hypothetical protein